VLRAIFEPGFFSNEPVRIALLVGTFVSAASAFVGVLVVMRAQSFAGHALSDVATAGGAGATVVGTSAASGFLVGGLVGAGAMEAIGVGRLRARDMATGIVLGAAMGATSLFFYLAATRGTSSATAQQVLFGSIYSVPSGSVPLSAAISAVVVAVVAISLRPIVLSSISDELAAVRGVRVRAIGTMFILALAVVVAMSSVVVGSILSTALLVGPAATALRLSRRVGPSLLLASAVAVGSTWLGILVSYDSYDWIGSGHYLPVSVCIVAVIVVGYTASGLVRRQTAAR
jgi:zinc/manganese transport system permease protein